jgi:predicted dehydrogenase
MTKKEETNKPRVRLAIVGCGAATERCHLPGARLAEEIEIAALVDKNMSRARRLGERFGVHTWTDDYRRLPDNIEGVVNALPHYLHAPVTIEFLERGIPVLVEKPMALNLGEAETMVKAASARGVVLQVGLMYRFCNGARVVKRAIDEGWLGELRSFTVEWGFVYDWPVASGFFFSKQQAGGGVLIDLGSHVLDLLLWWLGDVVDVEYWDDSLGGVEADCELSLVLRGKTEPINGTVVLSRLRNLSNRARVVGDRFTIECDISAPTSVRMWPTRSDARESALILSSVSSPPQSLDDAYADQLRAFGQTIAGNGASAVPAECALASVSLIDRCYRERRTAEMHWVRSVGEVSQS